MDKFKLSAQERKVLGRKVKTLRESGVLPANVYGKKEKSISVKVDLKDFEKVYGKAGETSLVDLELGKTTKPVLIDNVQKDPVTGQYLHVDFKQVDLKEKVIAQVPVELIGESPAEKQGLGTLVQQIDEIEVESLPTDIPEKFEIDVSGLEEVDALVHIKELKYNKSKVELKVEKDEIIVKIEPLREEEEPVVQAQESEEEQPEEGEEELSEGETKEEESPKEPEKGEKEESKEK